MIQATERRSEKRFRYHWPVWFAKDFNKELSQGQMVDVTSKSAAFTCYKDQCPSSGERITARFSVPKYGIDNSFDMASFTRKGRIHRVDEANPFLCRIVVMFSEHLPFKPGEQQDSPDQASSLLDSITI